MPWYRYAAYAFFAISFLGACLCYFLSGLHHLKLDTPPRRRP